MRWLLRSKIHNAVVTRANPNYLGSITIDEQLLEQVGILPGEKVLTGAIEMNGAAAHKIGVGEQIIIMGFELTDRQIKPKVALVDSDNKFVKFL
jgi:aspartate 1-decarboxylase